MAHDYSPAPERPVDVPMAPGNVIHDSSDDDSLALLPRNTVVRIVGNNRTKASLLGREAVIKKATGLGGWHWMVLSTGEEVKLQRNALMVLQYPTGNEQDFSEEEEEEQRRQAEQQQQRQRELQRQQQLEAAELEESRFRQRRAPRPLIAEEYPAPAAPISAAAMEKQRVSVRHLHQPRINLAKLDISALKRYRNYYQLPEPAGAAPPSKDDLVSLVAQHFAEQTVDEAQVIAHFLRAARRHAMGGRH